ncbi:hypothetical protein [Pseudomonas paraeruginosa]|uniref:hypothetical protein n=1 Tax=Pseudomonas paraeruginosa TaxID=2994495 RepID=UPI0039FD9B24
MKRTLTFASVAAFLTGCVATYEAPNRAEPSIVRTTSADVSKTVTAAKRVLVSMGYQVTEADAAAGVVSTAPKKTKLSPEQADCGNTMGLDYLLDHRTSAEFSVGIIISGDQMVVKGSPSAEYRPGQVGQDMVLTCVSTGSIESTIADQIISSVK